MSDRNGEVMVLSVPEQVTSPVPLGPAGESGSLTSLQSGLSREAFYENGDNEAKRESAIEEFQAALDNKTSLLTKSYGLQNKLSEYFKRKRGSGGLIQVESVEEIEVQYKTSMQKVDELTMKLKKVGSDCKTDLEMFLERCEEKRVSVNGDYERVLDKKRKISQSCIVPRSGRPVTSKDVADLEEQERKKDEELERARLDNIKHKAKLEKSELLLEEKEQVIEGLNLIDFEQLKIENQTYHEKIDERNEDLQKLHKKIERTVQILTHMKEKLEFVSIENQAKKHQLDKAEAELQCQRDELNRLKQQRERTRNSGAKLHKNMGLYGKEALLFDFEEQIDRSEEMKKTVAALKARHAALKKENAELNAKITPKSSTHSTRVKSAIKF